MNDEEVKRLSTLSGVHDFDEWKRHVSAAESAADQHLAGSVDDAWHSCLPIWKALGRANDLSRRVRVPKYWPSLATLLAQEFASRFWNDRGYLISVLSRSDPDSPEYLIAYDLLENMVGEPRRMVEVADLFQLSFPIPQVIKAEIAGLSEYDGLATETVGKLLERKYEIDWGDIEDEE